MRLLGNADGVVPYRKGEVGKPIEKKPDGLTPLQKAYTALILRHNELQTAAVKTDEERVMKRIMLRAYEEAIETVDQYRDHK